MKVFSSQLHKKYVSKPRICYNMFRTSTCYTQSVQFKYGYFCSTEEPKTLNLDVTTEEWRRRRATGNVAAVRREEAVIRSLGRKRGIQRRGKRSHVSTEPLTSLQALNITWLFATSGSQRIQLDQSQGKSCQPENLD